MIKTIKTSDIVKNQENLTILDEYLSLKGLLAACSKGIIKEIDKVFEDLIYRSWFYRKKINYFFNSN